MDIKQTIEVNDVILESLKSEFKLCDNSDEEYGFLIALETIGLNQYLINEIRDLKFLI